MNGPRVTSAYLRGQHLLNHWGNYSSCHIGAAARWPPGSALWRDFWLPVKRWPACNCFANCQPLFEGSFSKKHIQIRHIKNGVALPGVSTKDLIVTFTLGLSERTGPYLGSLDDWGTVLSLQGWELNLWSVLKWASDSEKLSHPERQQCSAEKHRTLLNGHPESAPEGSFLDCSL